MGIETKKTYKINIKELDDEDKKYIMRSIMEIDIFEETKKMYEREIKGLKVEIEDYKKYTQRLEKKIKEIEENERKIEIKEGQCGGLDIRIGNKEYLCVPSSKPKDIIVANSGKGYPEGQYYIELFFEWTEEEKEYCEIYDEYKEEELRFNNIEMLFSFLKQYLNRFNWNGE